MTGQRPRWDGQALARRIWLGLVGASLGRPKQRFEYWTTASMSRVLRVINLGNSHKRAQNLLRDAVHSPPASWLASWAFFGGAMSRELTVATPIPGSLFRGELIASWYTENPQTNSVLTLIHKQRGVNSAKWEWPIWQLLSVGLSHCCNLSISLSLSFLGKSMRVADGRYSVLSTRIIGAWRITQPRS